MNINGNMKPAMLIRTVMLLVVLGTFVVIPMHCFRRVSLGGTTSMGNPLLVHVAVSVATPPRHSVSFHPLSKLMNSAVANVSNDVVSPQVPFLNEMVMLRGGANGVAAIGRLNPMQSTLIKFVLLSMAVFAANKMIEGLWFYVFPRISATLSQPYTPTVHKYVWTDLWWPVVNQHYSYTQNIFFALVTSFWLQVWIPYWKDEATRVLRRYIPESWLLLRNGYLSWIQAVSLGFMALAQVCLLFLILAAVCDCWRYGKRALVEIAHDRTDRVKKAAIGMALVATTCALYYPLWRLYIW